MRLPQLTVRRMMAVVAMSALVICWFRPIGSSKAERIAQAHFLKIPGASRWIGRYKIRTGSVGEIDLGQPVRFADGWAVTVSDPRNGHLLAEYYLSPSGKLRAVDFAPGKFNERVGSSAR